MNASSHRKLNFNQTKDFSNDKSPKFMAIIGEEPKTVNISDTFSNIVIKPTSKDAEVRSALTVEIQSGSAN